jgi:hypothetical protein
LLQRKKITIRDVGLSLSLQTKRRRQMSTLPTFRAKDTYKVRNRKAYNSSLCKRGSFTLYLEDSVLKEWELCSQKKKQVGEQTYSESIIQCCLLMKISYGLKLRQSKGFWRVSFS